MKERLYHCLNRDTIQNIDYETLGTMLNFKDIVQNNLVMQQMTIVDWLCTKFQTSNELEPGAMWVFTIYNPNGSNFFREAFDPDNVCDVSYFEPHPYYMVVTVICQ